MNLKELKERVAKLPPGADEAEVLIIGDVEVAENVELDVEGGRIRYVIIS